jgi:hypothetical protein
MHAAAMLTRVAELHDEDAAVGEHAARAAGAPADVLPPAMMPPTAGGLLAARPARQQFRKHLARMHDACMHGFSVRIASVFAWLVGMAYINYCMLHTRSCKGQACQSCGAQPERRTSPLHQCRAAGTAGGCSFVAAESSLPLRRRPLSARCRNSEGGGRGGEPQVPSIGQGPSSSVLSSMALRTCSAPHDPHKGMCSMQARSVVG